MNATEIAVRSCRGRPSTDHPPLDANPGFVSSLPAPTRWREDRWRGRTPRRLPPVRQLSSSETSSASGGTSSSAMRTLLFRVPQFCSDALALPPIRSRPEPAEGQIRPDGASFSRRGAPSGWSIDAPSGTGSWCVTGVGRRAHLLRVGLRRRGVGLAGGRRPGGAHQRPRRIVSPRRPRPRRPHARGRPHVQTPALRDCHQRRGHQRADEGRGSFHCLRRLRRRASRHPLEGPRARHRAHERPSHLHPGHAEGGRSGSVQRQDLQLLHVQVGADDLAAGPTTASTPSSTCTRTR